MNSNNFIVTTIWPVIVPLVVLLVLTYRSHIVWCGGGGGSSNSNGQSCLASNIDIKTNIIDNSKSGDSFSLTLCPDSRLSFLAVSKTPSHVFVFTSLSQQIRESMKTVDKVDVQLGSITGQFLAKQFPDSSLRLIVKNKKSSDSVTPIPVTKTTTTPSITTTTPTMTTTTPTMTTTETQESNHTKPEPTSVNNDTSTVEEITETANVTTETNQETSNINETTGITTETTRETIETISDTTVVLTVITGNITAITDGNNETTLETTETDNSTETTVNIIEISNKTTETMVTIVEMTSNMTSPTTTTTVASDEQTSITDEELRSKRSSLKRWRRNGGHKSVDAVIVSVKVDGTVYQVIDNEEMHTSNVYGKNDTIKLTADDSSNLISFRDSYLVFCFDNNGASYLSFRCETEIAGKELYCRCKAQGFIQSFIVIIAILVVWLSMTFWIFWTKLREQPPGEPEVQVALSMCSIKTFSYQYIIDVMVGCPSSDFNIEKTTVDLELLDANRQSVANPVRFSTSKLPDPLSSPMRIVMGRLMPLPVITYIRANHSQVSDSAELYLYSVSVVEIPKRNKEARKLIQKCSVNQYIKNRPKLFAAKTGQNESVNKQPDIAVPALSWLDLQVLIFFSIALLATICMSVSVIQSHETLLQSLMSGLGSAAITLLISSLIYWIYKYKLRKLEAEAKHKMVGGSGSARVDIDTDEEVEPFNGCTLCRFAVLAIMLAVVVLATLAIVYFGLKLSFWASLFWLGSCLLAGVIVFGIWYIVAGVLSDTSADKSVRGHSAEDLEIDAKSSMSANESNMATKSDKSEPKFDTLLGKSESPPTLPKSNKLVANVSKSPMKINNQRIQTKIVDKR